MHRVQRGVFDLGLSDRENGWIVFVGERFSGTKSLLQALEYEFEDFEIVVADDVDVLLEKDIGYWKSARLMVVDCKICTSVREHLIDLKTRFSDVNVAIAYDDHNRQDQEIRASLECEMARGFVPMNLQLDVWLSAIRLLVNGGDYVPAELIETVYRSIQKYAMGRPKADPRNQETFKDNSANKREVGPATRQSTLTERELDVLRLASQGHQNKEIAARLGISEHTIKLHMHHVISKLGAHNRTEAAAAYFQRLAGGDG